MAKRKRKDTRPLSAKIVDYVSDPKHVNVLAWGILVLFVAEGISFFVQHRSDSLVGTGIKALLTAAPGFASFWFITKLGKRRMERSKSATKRARG